MSLDFSEKFVSLVFSGSDYVMGISRFCLCALALSFLAIPTPVRAEFESLDSENLAHTSENVYSIDNTLQNVFFKLQQIHSTLEGEDGIQNAVIEIWTYAITINGSLQIVKDHLESIDTKVAAILEKLSLLESIRDRVTEIRDFVEVLLDYVVAIEGWHNALYTLLNDVNGFLQNTLFDVLQNIIGWLVSSEGWLHYIADLLAEGPIVTWLEALWGIIADVVARLDSIVDILDTPVVDFDPPGPAEMLSGIEESFDVFEGLLNGSNAWGTAVADNLAMVESVYGNPPVSISSTLPVSFPIGNDEINITLEWPSSFAMIRNCFAILLAVIFAHRVFEMMEDYVR